MPLLQYTVAAALICFITQPAVTCAQSPPGDTLVIANATVLPMTSDTALVDHTVMVWRDRIVWIGPSSQARRPRNARYVEGRGSFLIPGLADMHVHLHATDELAKYVAAGVTTVRNMHGGPQHVDWRERVAAGALVGPTIFTAGPPVGQGRLNKDPRFVALKTVAEAEQVVKRQVAAGYDMIKIIQYMKVPVFEGMVAAARAANIPVVGHVVGNIGLERSLAAGQVSLEHAYGLRQRSRLDAVFGRNIEAQLDADARAIAKAGAWVGTIASARSGGCQARPPAMRMHITALHKAKVKLLAGSDAGIGPVPHGTGLHCELATLVAAGLTPYEALATATVNAGAFARTHLRRQLVPFGTLAVGSRADLVLLAADPRADIGAIAKPTGTVLRGVWLPR